MTRLINLFRALITLCIGLVIGILIIEILLRLNPQLLFRGMAVPSPVEPPLTRQTYDVRFSDADAFEWRSDLVRPIPPGEDQIEAHVVFETDEFGFRNHPPTSETVDVIVLGKSISLAAHQMAPWPEIIERSLSKAVLNLATPGGNISLKKARLKRFGLPHRPEWIVVEIIPSVDIRGDQSLPPYIIQQVFIPTLQNLLHKSPWGKLAISDSSPIYPIQLSLPKRTSQLTCCLRYMDFYTIDTLTLEKSADWIAVRSQLIDIIETARKNQACVALLIAPTKTDIYFPIARDPVQLEPAVSSTIPLTLGPDGFLVSSSDRSVNIDMIINNTFAGRDVIRKFAIENQIALIDPTDAMVSAILEGKDPFMVYDSHWNALGHELVAQSVAKVLNSTSCP